MFNFKKIKEEPVLIQSFDIVPKCTVCGSKIFWGQFAYEQNICWKCFKNRVMQISKNTESVEDMNIILHLLRVTEHYYGINELRPRNTNQSENGENING